MSEYGTQFTKLSKFAHELVVTEQRRVRRFVQGLNVEIQEGLVVAQVNTFTEALEKAQRIENVKAQVKTFQSQKRSAPSSTHEELRENVMPSKVKKSEQFTLSTMDIRNTKRRFYKRKSSRKRATRENSSKGPKSSFSLGLWILWEDKSH